MRELIFANAAYFGQFLLTQTQNHPPTHSLNHSLTHSSDLKNVQRNAAILETFDRLFIIIIIIIIIIVIIITLFNVNKIKTRSYLVSKIFTDFNSVVFTRDNVRNQVGK